MSKYVKLLVVLGFLLMMSSCKQDLTIKESSFSQSLVPEKYILPAEDGWWNWGMSPIYDENGKLHVFMSTIPHNGRWIKDSKIVHFTADGPEGPYKFADTTFASNSATYHNPQVSKVGDRYVMVYLVKERTTPRIKQQIGIATTKSLNEPWIESPHNPIIKASGVMDGVNIIHASNPTFLVDEDGEYRIYYKSITDKYKPNQYREISLATSDNIEGPYVNHEENPLISYADLSLDIEDPYAFYYKGMYHMIVEDRMDVKSALEGNPKTLDKKQLGGKRPGLIYESKDGIDWGKPEIGYNTNSHYFNEALARSERPNILWKNGKPEYLFLACHDEDPTAGYFLKIEDWK
ncbi:glycoside hydrolase family protein [Flavobacteriaceae bacterium]|nr:glycoside hydrolase family protein [Flavobacteriaceae bacterium]